MTALQRNSGLPLINDVPWGSHLCIFYETRDDLFEAAANYFEAGLQANEFCVWRLPLGLPADEANLELASRIDEFARYRDEHCIDIFSPSLHQFEADGAERFWGEKLERALAAGFEGLRGSGDSDVLPDEQQQHEYERWLHDFLVGKPALALCTYALTAARALDVFDVVRTHNVTIARRGGEWQFIEAPESQHAIARIRDIDDAVAIVSAAFPGRELLTERERMVLAYLINGASSKEAGRELGVSPRTIDFHRGNILEKLGARNTAEVIARALGRR